MRLKFVTISLSISLSLAFGTTLASTVNSGKRPISRDRIVGPDTPSPPLQGFPPTSAPVEAKDFIGEIFVMGTTWYDIQHNSTCGHQIRLDSEGYVHTAWMNALNQGAVERHIHYQLLSPDNTLVFPGGGIRVNQMNRAGYVDLELYPDNRAMPCFHQGQGGSMNYHTALAFDYVPRAGLFGVSEPPWVFYQGCDLEIVWPKVARSRDNAFHIFSTENQILPFIQRQYYIRGEFNPTTPNVTFSPEWVMVAAAVTISGTVAASPVSDRVVVGWLLPSATHPTDTTQHDNDAVAVISNDGLNWDWTDTLNITNWIPFDPGLLPDTLLADRDTFRCYAELDLIFDLDDVLHAFFTTEGYYHYEQAITFGNSIIWHWDEFNRVYSMVANGWFEEDFNYPGAWNRCVCRPQAALDSVTGEIYCMYQRYINPLGPSTQFPFPYQVGDYGDISAAGWLNGDIWITKSTDGGLTWAEGTNVTQTRSPLAMPGHCNSELTPSIYPRTADGKCHLFYVLDRDAGAVIQTEGTWTLNEVRYQRVPIDSIAATPLLPPYPMHCDSTGMPGAHSVENPGSRDIPEKFTLYPPSPNPFNSSVALSFKLQAASNVKLSVYDIQGRETARLAEGFHPAGTYQVEWDALKMASGLYFARLTTEGTIMTRKILLVK